MSILVPPFYSFAPNIAAIFPPANPGVGGGGGGGGTSPNNLIFDYMDVERLGVTGGQLWDIYTGEGAQETVLNYPPTNFSFSIDGAATNGQGQDMYWNFLPGGVGGYSFPTNYAQAFAHDPNVGLTDWTAVNRFSFRFKCDTTKSSNSTTFTPGSSPYLGYNIGTYIRPHGLADHSSQGQHYYHAGATNVYANKWWTIYLNRTPNHRVGCNPNINWGDDPQFSNINGDPDVTNGFSAVHYYDGLTRFYMSMFAADQVSAVLTNTDWTFGRFEYNTILNEADAEIYTITAGYTGARYEVFWNGKKGVDRTYEVRYRTTTMKNDGFSSGTDGGTTTNPGSAYTTTGWHSANMAEAVDGLFVAIRVQGNSDFTEIFLRPSAAI